MAQLTPMMQKYMETKEQYKDCILFYRLGDFYEMFFEDALTASRELEITLTGKDCGLDERAPMCGVPYHAVDGYLNKLVSKGYKVAICEQVEDPKTAKGLVKREVIRVVTPGTNLDTQALDARENVKRSFRFKDVKPHIPESPYHIHAAFVVFGAGINVRVIKQRRHVHQPFESFQAG